MKTILVDAIDGLIVETEDRFALFKEMHDLLETFPNPKVILTNANEEQSKAFGLDTAPYEVFTLKHNPEKTDPQYFEIMLRTLGLQGNMVIYFEHNPEAVNSAKSVGIVSYHYDHHERDLAALKNFLTENL